MIIHLNKNVSINEAQKIADELKAILVEKEEIILVTPSKLQEVPKRYSISE